MTSPTLFSLCRASVTARPVWYLRLTATTATLHTLNRSRDSYTIERTQRLQNITSLATLTSFIDRQIPVKQRNPFSILVTISQAAQRVACVAQVCALLHRLHLSPFALTHTRLFNDTETEPVAAVEQVDNLLATEQPALFSFTKRMLYATGGIIISSFLLCSSLVAWQAWQPKKEIVARKKKRKKKIEKLSHNKRELEKFGAPSPVPGCHPPLWRVRFTDVF